MIDTPYKVLGVGVAPMLGRQGDMRRMLGKLERETPEHTSVVGAKYIGKTVFLYALAEYIKKNESRFDTCIYWDISRYTPTDNADFFRRLSSQMLNSLEIFGAEYKDFFEDGSFEALREVFEELRDKNRRFLIIIDNLDKLLQIGNLTKEAWDNLRTLGELSSVCFVTGSRKRLRELIGSPEIQGSPFWNLFGDTPLTLTAFNEEDWTSFLTPFDGTKLSFGRGAVTELENFTGGIPILASAFCLDLCGKFRDETTITNEEIVDIAKDFVTRHQDILKNIWDDCGGAQGIIEELTKDRIDKSVIHPKDLMNLENNGIVSKKSGKVCRLINSFLDFEQPQIKDLERLFLTEENFKKNIKKVLRFRLSQLSSADETLQAFLGIMIEKIDDFKIFLAQLRSFSDHSLELIWRKDLPDGTIPHDWVVDWKFRGKLTNSSQDELISEGKIPVGGTQLKLLNLMTDARVKGSSSVSRAIYLMLNYLYISGNFGHHRKEVNMIEGDYEAPEEFVYSLCLIAIELCDLLTNDLSKDS